MINGNKSMTKRTWIFVSVWAKGNRMKDAKTAKKGKNTRVVTTVNFTKNQDVINIANCFNQAKTVKS